MVFSGMDTIVLHLDLDIIKASWIISKMLIIFTGALLIFRHVINSSFCLFINSFIVTDRNHDDPHGFSFSHQLNKDPGVSNPATLH